MRRFFLLVTMSVLCLCVKAQKADLVFQDVTVPEGSEIALMTVSLSTSETNASALQCDVFAPEGMSIIDTEEIFPDAVGILAAKSGRKYLWNLDWSHRNDGSVRFLAYGTSLPTFMTNYTSSDLSLFTIPFSVKGLSAGKYTVTVKQIELGNGNGEKVQNYTTASATITIAAHEHSFVYTDNGDGTHTGRCIHCNDTVTDKHEFVDGYCVVCGAPDPMVFDTNIDAYDNIVFVKPMAGKSGKQATLSLQMNNNLLVTGFQCDLVLPKGITVAKDEDGFALIDLSKQRTSAKKTDFFSSAVQSDGSIRIMCSSTQSYTFAGNTGEVATIVVDIDKTLNSGDYPMVLKNVVISDLNANTVKVPYVKTSLTLSSYTLGDANDDGDINVGDFTAIANYILGNPPASFVEPAADVNEDGDINVGDLTGEANLILYGKVRVNGAKPHAAKFANVAVADQTIEAGNELTVDVAINGSYAFSGCQFDMVLPAGVTVKNAYLSTDRTNAKATDLFTSSMIDSNTLRVVCASTTGAEFEGAEGSVARIVLVADNSYSNDNIVNVENVILSSNADVVMPQATSFVLRAAGTTGINGINADADATIYDLTGKKMNSNRLQKGVYVVNGKKIVK